MKLTHASRALLAALVSLLLGSVAFAQVPVVRKIDPPNWWINYTQQFSLLLNGEGFSGVRVVSHTPGVEVLDSDPSGNGHYLFVHLQITKAAKPGKAHFQLIVPAGSTSFDVPLFARSDAAGDFQGFSRDDVIYLIMPDRFADGDPSNDQPPGSKGIYDRNQPKAYHGGDLRGIREHLGYLHDLGVTTLWLTPIWKNADSDYHGYHVVDFYAVDEHMGSMADYQALVADAHKLGMKVLIDFVANHTGPQHPWVNDPPTPTWFHGTPADHLQPSYSFAGLVDPHAPRRESRNTLEGWFVDKLPDLDPDDPELGYYLSQNVLWWTEMAHLDGLRLDTFPYSSRRFWSAWHTRVHAVYPHMDDVAEVADPDPSITAFFEGGRKQFDGIDSGASTVFDFPLCQALRDVIISNAPMQKLINVLRDDELYEHPENLVTFFGNHDDGRFVSEEGSSPAKLKAAFSLLLTMRGIPQIYAGDEIGMQGGNDPDNRRDFPGGFPGDSHNAFTAAGRSPEQQDVYAHVQSLLALRKNHPALRIGKQWHIGWDDTYYAFVRQLPRETLFVVYNNADSARALEIPVFDTPLQYAHGFNTIFGNGSARIMGDKVSANVPARSALIFQAY